MLQKYHYNLCSLEVLGLELQVSMAYYQSFERLAHWIGSLVRH